jgi:hypothetical protein
VRLALAVCVLLLLAPAAALADYPVISYLDENGVFRLYEAEFATEVDPPPPVPANFPGFRYAVSLNGRYIVFNDAGKKLHLLDRATNAQLPLPGIDVYTDPGALTVSDNGLIAFDNNGSGPALVYDSSTGQFVDTGLPAGNGHRQTRLSADGRFLGTTCDTGCFPDLDFGADPYVRDLTSKADTGFPNDATADEEFPCINGDGSLVGFDKRSGIVPYDVHVFDRSVSPPQELSLPGLNGSLTDETHCVLDRVGAYVGLTYSGTPAFRVYQVASQEFLTLPADKEFDSRSMFSEHYSAPAPPAPGGGAAAPPPSGDRTKPVASRFRMTHRRFRPARRATAFRFALSETAGVRIVIRRLGRYAGQLRRRGLPAGGNTVYFGGRLRGRKLRPGPYVAVLIATDVAGNLSLPVMTTFRVLRPEGDRRP